jgi:hypothetical protein
MPSKCVTALLVATLFLPSVSTAAPPAPRPTPIADAVAQQAREHPVVLRQVQTAPIRFASGKPSRLLPILIGAGVGCGLGAWAGAYESTNLRI